MNELASNATEIININKECFIAQWILQNPDKNIADYTLTYKGVLEGGVCATEFSINIKEK